MDFQQTITSLSAHMLEQLTLDAAPASDDGNDLLSNVTSSALTQYSTLFLFIAENNLQGEFFEWCTAKSVDITYGFDSRQQS